MVDLAKARNSMKQRAKNGEKSCLVYREVCASASQEVLDFLPSAAVCSRTMRNAQKNFAIKGIFYKKLGLFGP